jgi:nicotinamide mononucleotide adenylyltransferase
MSDLRTALAKYSTRRRGSGEIPTLGTIYFQSVTEGERQAMVRATVEEQKSPRALMIQQMITDEHGERIYADGDADYEEIIGLDSVVTTAIAEMLENFSQLETLEETAKN